MARFLEETAVVLVLDSVIHLWFLRRVSFLACSHSFVDGVAYSCPTFFRMGIRSRRVASFRLSPLPQAILYDDGHPTFPAEQLL